MHDEALTTHHSLGDLDRPACLNAHAHALLLRFKQSGDLFDLNRAISRREEAF